MSTDRLRKKQKLMIEAMVQSSNIVSLACEAVGITRQTHYNWIKANKRYAEEIESLEEKQIDLAENKLMVNVKKGNQRSIEFYLNSKGTKRGYGKNTLHVENTGTLHVTPSKEDYDKARKEMEEHFGSK